MASVREDGPAVAAADVERVDAPERSAEHKVDGLLTLTVGVLRTLGGNGPGQVEVSPGVSAETNLDAAVHAAAGLRALRSALQDYVDRTQIVPSSDESTIRATRALRNLL